MNKKAIVKRYMKKIQKLLPGFRVKKTKLFVDLENEISSYAEQSDSLTYEQLVEQFGHPSDLVTNYLSEESPEILQRKLRFARMMRITACGVIVITIICVCIYFAWWAHIQKIARESYIYRETVEIIQQQ